MPNIISHWDCSNKSTVKYSYTPIRRAKIEKTDHIKC